MRGGGVVVVLRVCVCVRRGAWRWWWEAYPLRDRRHAVEGYACDRDAEEGGRDGHREGGKANQGEPVQGAHQSAGDAKSEWRQAEGGEEEGKGCVCGSEQVSL